MAADPAAADRIEIQTRRVDLRDDTQTPGVTIAVMIVAGRSIPGKVVVTRPTRTTTTTMTVAEVALWTAVAILARASIPVIAITTLVRVVRRIAGTIRPSTGARAGIMIVTTNVSRNPSRRTNARSSMTSVVPRRRRRRRSLAPSRPVTSLSRGYLTKKIGPSRLDPALVQVGSGKTAVSQVNPFHDAPAAPKVKKPESPRSRDPITGVSRIGSDFVYDCHETWLHAGSRVSPRQEAKLFAMSTKVLTAGNAVMKLLRDSRSQLFALQPVRVGVRFSCRSSVIRCRWSR
jgi:hypothetical protein